MQYSKKKAVVAGSAGLMALALLVGGVTTATWTDGVAISGAQITAGNLDIEKVGDTTWFERSPDSSNLGNEISLPDYRIIPGDTIQARQDLDVALEGKNMKAIFSVNTPQLNGDLYSESNGVSASFTVVDENDSTVVPDTPLSDPSPEVLLYPDDVTPTVDGIKDYTFIVTLNFDENTSDRVRTQARADLEEISFLLNQTREDIPTLEFAKSDTFALGYSHGCGIRGGGEVWCWGTDDKGQLGNGTVNNTGDGAVRAGTINNAVAVENGRYTSFAITSNGDLYAWGDNRSGQLGLGINDSYVYSPMKVPVSNVAKVSAEGAESFSAILLDDGTMRVAGTGSRIGAGGQGSNTYISPSREFTDIKQMDVHFSNIYVIDGDGTVWGTGDGGGNALGGRPGSTGWVRIGNHDDAEKLYARYGGAVYERSNGEVWGWGNNFYGSIGSVGYPSDPVRLEYFEGAKELDFGWYHVVMLKEDGTVWTGGYGLGAGAHTNESIAHMKKVVNLSGVDSIQADHHMSAVSIGDVRYAWGENINGTLGTAITSGNVSIPEIVIH